jgi:large subunit ribosomal protein L23
MGILSVFRKKASKEQEKKVSPKAKEKKEAPERGEKAIIRPVVTEKAFSLQSSGVYTFIVEKGATKQSIRSAVERQFGVHVKKVNVIDMPGKKRQRRRIVGHVPGYRKALVRVRDGESIDITAESR